MAPSKHPQFSVKNAYLVEGVEQRGISGGIFQPSSYGPAAQYMEPIQSDLNSSGRLHLKDMFEGGKYRFGDGTSTAPAISFALDTDLGFFRNASNQMTATGKLLTTTTTTLPALLIGSLTSEPSTLVNGDIWYNSDRTKFRCQEAGAVRDFINISAFKTTTEAVTNSTALQDDNELSLTFRNSQKYSFKIWGSFTCSGGATGGIRIAVNGTASLFQANLFATIYDPATAAIVAMGDVTVFNTAVLSGNIGAGLFIIEGSVRVNAAGVGTILLRWAQDNATPGQNTTVAVGSYIEAEDIT